MSVHQLNHNKTSHKIKHSAFSTMKFLASFQHYQNIDFQTAINLEMRSFHFVHITHVFEIWITKCPVALNFLLIQLNIILTLGDINCYSENWLFSFLSVEFAQVSSFCFFVCLACLNTGECYVECQFERDGPFSYLLCLFQ